MACNLLKYCMLHEIIRDYLSTIIIMNARAKDCDSVCLIDHGI